MHPIVKCPFAPFKARFAYERRHQYFMQCAYNEAIRAWNEGEVPIGAVAVIDDKIVASAYNRVEKDRDATAHAEMSLIRQLSKNFGDWRLSNVTLYITKEPCPMCSGAIYKARISSIYIGLYDEQQGCVGGCCHFNHTVKLNHKLQVYLEPLDGACETLLKTFFKLRRCALG